MTVPDRRSSAALLLELEPPPWFLAHTRAVAEIAAWLARRIALRGVAVDRRLVEAAALLHDVDKLLPGEDPTSHLPHGAGSAAWLAARGHPELGPVVIAHPVARLLDAPDERRRVPFSTREERIVAYADKRAGQRLESIDRRFGAWQRRYPGGWDPATARRVRRRAARLEADVCVAAGIRPAEVRRLAWTGRALRAAR